MSPASVIYNRELAYLALALVIARLAPNTMQIVANFNPAIPLGHKFDTSWMFYITDGAPFIYFQF